MGLLRKVRFWLKRVAFPGSAAYWDRRYRRGRTSGAGSYGENAQFKADFLNAFVREHDVRRVVELGCGDGAQLSLAKYPDYVGVDVAPTAVELCRSRFAGAPGRRFFYASERAAWRLARGYDAALSLDVVYHLVEDDVFLQYMDDLFEIGDRFVVVYSWNEEAPHGWEAASPHLRRRRFTDWVETRAPNWRLIQTKPHPRPGMPGFFVFERRVTAAGN